jgi:hypothetical protein
MDIDDEEPSLAEYYAGLNGDITITTPSTAQVPPPEGETTPVFDALLSEMGNSIY